MIRSLPEVWRRRALVLAAVMLSWVTAVALLMVILRCLPVTPGYVPDHLE